MYRISFLKKKSESDSNLNPPLKFSLPFSLERQSDLMLLLLVALLMLGRDVLPMCSPAPDILLMIRPLRSSSSVVSKSDGGVTPEMININKAESGPDKNLNGESDLPIILLNASSTSTSAPGLGPGPIVLGSGKLNLNREETVSSSETKNPLLTCLLQYGLPTKAFKELFGNLDRIDNNTNSQNQKMKVQKNLLRLLVLHVASPSSTTFSRVGVNWVKLSKWYRLYEGIVGSATESAETNALIPSSDVLMSALKNTKRKGNPDFVNNSIADPHLAGQNTLISVDSLVSNRIPAAGEWHGFGSRAEKKFHLKAEKKHAFAFAFIRRKKRNKRNSRDSKSRRSLRLEEESSLIPSENDLPVFGIDVPRAVEHLGAKNNNFINLDNPLLLHALAYAMVSECFTLSSNLAKNSFQTLDDKHGFAFLTDDRTFVHPANMMKYSAKLVAKADLREESLNAGNIKRNRRRKLSSGKSEISINITTNMVSRSSSRLIVRGATADECLSAGCGRSGLLIAKPVLDLLKRKLSQFIQLSLVSFQVQNLNKNMKPSESEMRNINDLNKFNPDAFFLRFAHNNMREEIESKSLKVDYRITKKLEVVSQISSPSAKSINNNYNTATTTTRESESSESESASEEDSSLIISDKPRLEDAVLRPKQTDLIAIHDEAGAQNGGDQKNNPVGDWADLFRFGYSTSRSTTRDRGYSSSRAAIQMLRLRVQQGKQQGNNSIINFVSSSVQAANSNSSSSRSNLNTTSLLNSSGMTVAAVKESKLFTENSEILNRVVTVTTPSPALSEVVSSSPPEVDNDPSNPTTDVPRGPNGGMSEWQRRHEEKLHQSIDFAGLKKRNEYEKARIKRDYEKAEKSFDYWKNQGLEVQDDNLVIVKKGPTDSGEAPVQESYDLDQIVSSKVVQPSSSGSAALKLNEPNNSNAILKNPNSTNNSISNKLNEGAVTTTGSDSIMVSSKNSKIQPVYQNSKKSSRAQQGTSASANTVTDLNMDDELRKTSVEKMAEVWKTKLNVLGPRRLPDRITQAEAEAAVTTAIIDRGIFQDSTNSQQKQMNDNSTIISSMYDNLSPSEMAKMTRVLVLPPNTPSSEFPFPFLDERNPLFRKTSAEQKLRLFKKKVAMFRDVYLPIYLKKVANLDLQRLDPKGRRCMHSWEFTKPSWDWILMRADPQRGFFERSGGCYQTRCGSLRKLFLAAWRGTSSVCPVLVSTGDLPWCHHFKGHFAASTDITNETRCVREFGGENEKWGESTGVKGGVEPVPVYV